MRPSSLASLIAMRISIFISPTTRDSVFVDSAFVDAMNRCVVVEAALAAGDDIAFHDQVHTPYSDPAHPLYDLALWPDRNACIGKDFAF